MNKKIVILCAAAVVGLAGLGIAKSMDNSRQNPFLQPYTTPYEIPPFDKVEYGDYLPALEAGIAEQKAGIEAICANTDTPTFENTIGAFEDAANTLNKVVLVFGALSESNSSPEMESISEEFFPKLSQSQDEIMMNDKLFERFKYLYDHRNDLGLAPDQVRAVETYYKNFVRAGALLNADQKKELQAINTELANLYLQFNKNLLNATNSFAIVVDNPERLSGLPANVVAVAAEEAANRNLGEGKWVFTLHAPCRLPVLQYANDRALREEMYKGYTTQATTEPYNNLPVINKILQARSKKARLLGFDNFGSYMTDKVMAKTVKNAEDLLSQIWAPAVSRVKEEVADMQALADR